MGTDWNKRLCTQTDHTLKQDHHTPILWWLPHDQTNTHCLHWFKLAQNKPTLGIPSLLVMYFAIMRQNGNQLHDIKFLWFLVPSVKICLGLCELWWATNFHLLSHWFSLMHRMMLAMEFWWSANEMLRSWQWDTNGTHGKVCQKCVLWQKPVSHPLHHKIWWIFSSGVQNLWKEMKPHMLLKHPHSWSIQNSRAPMVNFHGCVHACPRCWPVQNQWNTFETLTKVQQDTDEMPKTCWEMHWCWWDADEMSMGQQWDASDQWSTNESPKHLPKPTGPEHIMLLMLLATRPLLQRSDQILFNIPCNSGDKQKSCESWIPNPEICHLLWCHHCNKWNSRPIWNKSQIC